LRGHKFTYLLGSCSSHHLHGAGYIVSATLQAA